MTVSIQFTQSTFSRCSSVRAMQYVLDVTVNIKKPDDLVHKLPYKCYKIWPLVLWPLPEDVKKLAHLEKFL